MATEGERAAEEASRQERAEDCCGRGDVGPSHQGTLSGHAVLKSEAEALLRACELQQRVARTLLEKGGNHDIYPAGQWVIRPIPNHPTGKAFGVYLVGEEDRDKRSNVIAFPSNYAPKTQVPFVDGSAPDDERSTPMTGAVSLEKRIPTFRHSLVTA